MFEVTGDAAIASDPRQGSLDNPSLWQDGEAFCARFAPHDFQCPLAGFRYRRRRVRSLIVNGGSNIPKSGAVKIPSW